MREMGLTWHPDGPNAALVNIQEIGVSAYCGRADRGKLQLAVKTARPITPLELTIEHFPDTHYMTERGLKAVTGVGPKEVELWDYIADAAIWNAVRNFITQRHPDIMTAKSRQPADSSTKLKSSIPAGFPSADENTTS